MAVRAKFRVSEIIQHDQFGGLEHRTVKMRAVQSKEGDNATWSEATPSGELTMRITNPTAHSQFAPGQEFYVDFTPVE